MLGIENAQTNRLLDCGGSVCKTGSKGEKCITNIENLLVKQLLNNYKTLLHVVSGVWVLVLDYGLGLQWSGGEHDQ